jgi:hypothetical protein
MRSFVITVPHLFNSIDPGKIWVQAVDSEVAIVMVFDAVWQRNRAGIVLDHIKVEEREPNWSEMLFGYVTPIEDFYRKEEEAV